MPDDLASTLSGAALLVVVVIAWAGVAMCASNAYGWGRKRGWTMPAVIGAAFGGTFIGIAGGWLVAHIRALSLRDGHATKRWWIAAVAMWALSTFMAESSSTELLTGADITVWRVAFQSLPLIPVAAAFLMACLLSIGSGTFQLRNIRVPQSAFWVSILVVCIVVPKPA